MVHRSSRLWFCSHVVCVVISLLALGFLPTAHADQSIIVRSGNGVVGTQDAQVRFVRYAVGQDTPPTASDFNAVQTGAFAYVDAPYTTYIEPAAFSDPLAQWIGTTPALGGGSALYGIPFGVTDPIIAAATLSLGYSVDNAVHGVYINGTEISNFVNDGDYHGEYYYMRSDIASLLIPNATNWLYIKTYDYAGLAGLMFSATITTQGTSPGAPTITPNTGGNSGSVSFRIIASGFEAGTSPGATPSEAGATVTLTGTGPSIAATNVNVVSPNILTGTFDLTGASPGVGTVTVTNRDGTSSVLTNAFSVSNGGTPQVGIQKIGTPPVDGRNQTFYISLINSGNVDAYNVPATELMEPWYSLVNADPQPGTIASVDYLTATYPGFLEWTFSSVPASQSIAFSYTTLLNPTVPAGSTVNGPTCLTGSNAICKGLLYQCTKRYVPAACVAGVEGGPWGVAATCIIATVECYAGYEGCIEAGKIACSKVSGNVRTSLDPNDLVGPTGFGNPGWFQTPALAQYSLSFNNLPSATNSATNIYVTDSFDGTNLDLSSLAVSAITIGSVNFSPSTNFPLTGQAFGHDIDLRPAQNLIVRVNASLDQTTNKANVSFLSLDPSTGLEPTDATVGFLPPGAGASVLFTVNPKPSLPTGTAIQSSGSVIFDSNAAINTNTYLNTVDITPPTSQVIALPAVTTNPSINVSWTGTDVGSGIQYYTIYVSDNGGAYTAWQTNTTSTSATYTGAVGHTYGFYSIATDNVNNVQAAKTTADTTIQVVAMIGTTTAVTASPNPANAGANVTLTASVSPSAGTGVPTGTVIFNDGSTQLGTGTLSGSGQATYSTSALASGSHSITAVYSGDSTYTGSTSPTLAEVINAPSFSISVSPTTVTVSQGQSGQTTLTVTPGGGFNSAISLSCSGQPANSTCTLSPSSVTPDGSNSAVTSTVSIATDARVTAAVSDEPRRRQGTFLALILFGLPVWFFSSFRRRVSALRLVIWVLVLLGIEIGMAGCGSNGPKTPKGTSTITITATSGSTSESATFTLVVQ